MNNQELMAGWARERLIAVRRATPAPGGDVAALAYEVARSYGELATFLPGVQPPPGDPGQWAPGAVVKAGAAVIGVLDELRTPGGPGKSHDLPELFFAASVQRTLTGGPDAVTAACVSALTGDAEQLWARAFGKLLVYAISVPVVGLIDDLTGMLAEAVAARRWINLQRQLMLCGKELASPSTVGSPEPVAPPVGIPEPVEPAVGLPAPAALLDGPGQVRPAQPETPSVSRNPFPRRGPTPRTPQYKADSGRTEPPGRSAARPEYVPRSSSPPAGTSGSPWPPSPPEGPKAPGSAGATEPRRPRPQAPSASDAKTPPRPQPNLRPLRGVPPTAPGAPGNGPLLPPRMPPGQPTTPPPHSQRVPPRTAAMGTPSQPPTPPAPAVEPPQPSQSVTLPAQQPHIRHKLPPVPPVVEPPPSAPAIDPPRESVPLPSPQSETLPEWQPGRWPPRIPPVVEPPPSVPEFGDCRRVPGLDLGGSVQPPSVDMDYQRLMPVLRPHVDRDVPQVDPPRVLDVPSGTVESRAPEIGFLGPPLLADPPSLPSPPPPQIDLPEPPGRSGPGFPGR